MSSFLSVIRVARNIAVGRPLKKVIDLDSILCHVLFVFFLFIELVD